MAQPWVSHQEFYARDAAVAAECERRKQAWVIEEKQRRWLPWTSWRDNDRQLAPVRVNCQGTLRFDEVEPTLAVCDGCDFEVVRPGPRDPYEHIVELIRRSGLPDGYLTKPFHTRPENAKAVAVCRAFVEGVGKAPALHGPPGVGKTLLLTFTGVRLCRKGRRVIYRDMASLLRMERDYMDRPQGVRPLQVAIDADVLLLDDLGAEHSTPWATEQIQWIVDERDKHGQPVLLATNLAPMDWPEAVGERTASRLAGATEAAAMGGPDQRLL